MLQIAWLRTWVVVASWGFWQRELGGDPGAVGRTVRLNDEPFTVVGVMPRSFAFPSADVQSPQQTMFVVSL